MNKQEILHRLHDKSGSIHVLFVCSGNMLRSPVAELYFEKILKEKHGETNLIIESGAVTFINDSIMSEARQYLRKEGVSSESINIFRPKHISNHPELFRRADIIFGMTGDHLDDLNTLGFTEKSFLINKFAFNRNEDISDPYFSGNFALSFKQVKEACIKILKIFEEAGIIKKSFK